MFRRIFYEKNNNKERIHKEAELKKEKADLAVESVLENNNDAPTPF